MLRTDRPNALTSRAYAKDFNEVKKVGSLNSTSRTPDRPTPRFLASHPRPLDARSAPSPRPSTWTSSTAHGSSRPRTWPPPMPRSAAGTTSTTGTPGARSPPSARPRATETRQPKPTRHGHRSRPSTPVATPPALVTPPFPEHRRPQLRGRFHRRDAAVLLRHRQDRLQRIQQQIRDHPDLPPLLRRTHREHQRRVWPASTSGPPTSKGPSSATRSRATSTALPPTRPSPVLTRGQLGDRRPPGQRPGGRCRQETRAAAIAHSPDRHWTIRAPTGTRRGEMPAAPRISDVFTGRGLTPARDELRSSAPARNSRLLSAGIRAFRRPRTRRRQSRAAGLACTPTLTRPRHTAPRVLRLPRRADPDRREGAVVSDVILRVTSKTPGRGDLCGAAFIGLGDHSAATALASRLSRKSCDGHAAAVARLKT